jgi:hypothetical protein
MGLAAVAAWAGCAGRPGAGAAPAAASTPARIPDRPPLCPAFPPDGPPNLCPGADARDFRAKVIDKTYACGELLQGTGKLLDLWRDPFTGLPYAEVPFGGPHADQTGGAEPAAGVFPQLAQGQGAVLAEDPATAVTTVDWRFVDRAPDNTLPSLLWALQISLAPEGDRKPAAKKLFGGLAWRARADVSRYAKLRIRYRTSAATSRWRLELRSGTTREGEPAVTLPGATAWRDLTFDLARDFPGLDAAHLDALIFTSPRSHDDGGGKPTLWIDQVGFLAAPARLDDCATTCPSPLPAYPDLACLEPQTSAADVAAALSFLATAPEAGQLDAATAEASAARVLASLEALPGAHPGARADGATYSGGGWFQDWHSPVSLMPSPTRRTASLGAQSQLFAALMIVETTYPALAARAAALRGKMDFAVLFDRRHGCPGSLLASLDRCEGRPDSQDAVAGLGTRGLLAAFLAAATNAVPLDFWTTALAAHGCALHGPASAPWFGADDPCPAALVPARDGGGPSAQLAGLVYLDGGRIPVGRLSLDASGRNMLAAQAGFARARGLGLAGWSSAATSDGRAGQACAGFAPEKVSPYPWALAASDAFPEAYRMLRAFHLLGADNALITGDEIIPFGFREAFDQATARAEDGYRYLDTGLTDLGLQNACRDDLVRRRFGLHPVARAGYALAASVTPPCP